jgi:hypothetical protein
LRQSRVIGGGGFLEEANGAFAALRIAAEAWNAEQQRREIWAGADQDRLERE